MHVEILHATASPSVRVKSNFLCILGDRALCIWRGPSTGDPQAPPVFACWHAPRHGLLLHRILTTRIFYFLLYRAPRWVGGRASYTTGAGSKGGGRSPPRKNQPASSAEERARAHYRLAWSLLPLHGRARPAGRRAAPGWGARGRRPIRTGGSSGGGCWRWLFPVRLAVAGRGSF
jgi:hypothetical protein